MSLRLRLKYHYRSFWQVFAMVSIPEWFFSRTIKMLLLGLIVVTATFYLFEVNAISTSGYVTHDLEVKISRLQNDQQKLEAEVASYQSLAKITSRLDEVSMVPAQSISYVNVNPETAVAKR